MSTAKQLILHSGGDSQVADSFEALFVAMLSPFGVFEVVFDTEKQVSDYRLVNCNPAFQKMLGAELHELKKNLTHQTFLGGGEHWLGVFSRVALKNHSLRFEYYSSETDGHYEVQAFSSTPGTFACLFNDVTERKAVQKRLEASEGHFRTLVESIGELIVCFDREGRRTYVSPQYEQLTGLSANEVLGKTLLEDPQINSMGAQLHKVLQDVFLSGCESSCFFTQQHPIKGPRTIEIRFYPEFSPEGVSGVISCSRDITDVIYVEEERNHLKQKLHEAERLAYMGQLASSLSLQISQPLASLDGISSSLQDFLKGKQIYDGDMGVLFSQHRKALLEIESVVKGLNYFSKKDEGGLEVFDIHLLLEETLGMFQSIFLKNRIEFKKDFFSKSLPIKVYKRRFQQVLMNMISNACDSLIHTERENKQFVVRTLLEKKRCVISFCDNGQGIPVELQSKIFQPFFTTKSKGHAIGLGLSMSQHIIHEIGGAISFDSEYGKGAHFKIEVPILIDPVQLFDNEEKRLKLASQCCEKTKFSLRVLLVDDEDSVRFVLANFLSDMGMMVDEAAGVREAFNCLKQQHYDYVLTDFHMDEMNGDELAQKAREEYPALKFISISADPNLDRTDVYSGFIAKPFDLKAITQLFNKLSVK